MEYNRNLSSVIDSIEDDGPSLSLAGESSAASASPGSAVIPRGGKRRSALWIIVICLLAGLLLAGVFLLATGGSGGYFPLVSRSAAPAPAAPEPAVDVQLWGLQKSQALLGSRIDRLAASVAQNSAAIAQWRAQQAAEAAARTAQQDVAVAAAADQKESSTPAGGQEAEAVLATQQDVVAVATADQKESSTPGDGQKADALLAAPAVVPAAEPNTGVSEAVMSKPAPVPAPPSAPPVTRPVKADKAPVPQPPARKAAGTATKSTPSPKARPHDKAVSKADAKPEADVVKTSAGAAAAPVQSSAQQDWVLNVAYFERREPIIELMEKFWQSGIVTEQQKVTVKGKTGYRLRITGFSSSAEASEFAKHKIDAGLGIKDPWVSRR